MGLVALIGFLLVFLISIAAAIVDFVHGDIAEGLVMVTTGLIVFIWYGVSDADY